ncbi:Uncharacterised protein [uncultured archaeon]|nr:Uncharacterised protein [uncultured archaeon]
MVENRSIEMDALIAFAITVAFALVMYFALNLQDPFSYLQSPNTLSLFLNILVSILGVIAIIISLFTIFEDTYKENRAIKALKARGQYSQIFTRYGDSILILFVSIIIILIAHFILSLDTTSIPQLLMTTIFGVIFFIIVLSFIRTYRCLSLFKLLQDAIKFSEKGK